MKIKSISMTLALALASVCANAAQSYPMTLQSPPEKSKVTQTYDETTGVYSIHVDENPFGTDSSVLPAVRLSALTEVLPDYAKTLTFEYKASKPSGPVKLSYTISVRKANSVTKLLKLRRRWMLPKSGRYSALRSLSIRILCINSVWYMSRVNPSISTLSSRSL